MSMYEQFFAWTLMWFYLLFLPTTIAILVFLWVKLIIETVKLNGSPI